METVKSDSKIFFVTRTRTLGNNKEAVGTMVDGTSIHKGSVFLLHFFFPLLLPSIRKRLGGVDMVATKSRWELAAYRRYAVAPKEYAGNQL